MIASRVCLRRFSFCCFLALTLCLYPGSSRGWSEEAVANEEVKTEASGSGSALERQDDFSAYLKGGDASPNWEATSVEYEIADSACVTSGGVSFWQIVPFGCVVTFSCDVTVLELLKGAWLTAGLGLYASEQDYWAINLVVSPEDQKRRRFTEMNESLDGNWLANFDKTTGLKQLATKGQGLHWDIGQTYRMEMSLNRERITGRILHQGEEVALFGYKLEGAEKAVRWGRPALRVNGMRVRFDNASVRVNQVAEIPKKPRHILPWRSRPGEPLAIASGYFRTVEVGGRWWMVDPEGKPFFVVGTDHVNYRSHWCEKLGYAPYARNVAAKYGSEESWAEKTIERLVDWGFNTLPAGHSPSLRYRGLAHILFASVGSSFARFEWIAEPVHWTGFPDVFSPRWERHCRLVARRIAKESAGDPWCIGAFLDNELEWYGKKGHLVDDVFRLGPDRPAKEALFDWLIHRRGDLAGINRLLGTQYPDRSAFLKSDAVPGDSAGLDEVRSGFLAVIAERYFDLAAKAFREADPDHLVMGCRFAGRAPSSILEIAGRANDVFTFNTYPRVDFEDTWSPDAGGTVWGVPRELVAYYGSVGKPMIITEWSFPALDSKLPCKHGAGMRVDTQEQKAACYRIFANAMADLPFLLGYHYFMWADEPELGISSTFPEDSNYGLVNEKDEPYEVLVKTAAEVNRQAAARHSRSIFSSDLELRETPDGVEVVNAGKTSGRGTLRMGEGGQQRLEELLLEAGDKRKYAGQGNAWVIELQIWDGTKARITGGTRDSYAVTNVSSNPFDRIPIALESADPKEGEVGVTTAYIERLEPGQTRLLTPLAGKLEPLESLELKSGEVVWSCHRRDGSLFDHIQAGNLPLGRLVFAAHQKIEGNDQWVSTDRVEELRVHEQPDAWVVEAIVERAGQQPGVTEVDGQGKMKEALTGPARFRAAVRAVVFKREGTAFVKPLWVESLDSRPWRFVEAFWFNRPSIGGSPDGDTDGAPDVPNYYRNAQFWTDEKLGGLFGAVSMSPEWRVSFWKDAGGGFHPDSYLKVDQAMSHGSRWSGKTTPYHWIFAARDAAKWRDIALRCQRLRRALIRK